jgi:hypothetical protein
LYNILIEFNILVELVRLIKMFDRSHTFVFINIEVYYSVYKHKNYVGRYSDIVPNLCSTLA